MNGPELAEQDYHVNIGLLIIRKTDRRFSRRIVTKFGYQLLLN